MYFFIGKAAWFNRNNSPLDLFQAPFNILNRSANKIEGIHNPYLYGGTPGTVFSWHVAD